MTAPVMAWAWLLCAMLCIREEQRASGYCSVWAGVRAFVLGPAMLCIYVLLIGCDCEDYIGRDIGRVG